ncbi:membrane-fusion protein [Sanguibacter keddieii DSM 10542]|uniref:Membrane-fusion protein n=1 Tax=Sanguibacter keddieii (strain ATCC 51767 / DSM 10542 / NCFB 3025 / ST-74) TaxID=446469 RepID=D1BK25_SANKS|nr:peptidoglycan-binding protein [Sanguibacter keddieii]ACZ22434.1 membrane-fusion protein [Sanguibacter keddieii DSM 10542]
MTARENSPAGGPGRSRTTRRALLLGASLAAVGLVLGVILVGGSSDATTTDDTAGTVATTPVVRETLVRSEKHKGSVGFGEPRAVGAPEAGESEDGARTVTWLPEVGAVVDRGQQLWRTDDRPTLALFGELPAYRELGVGDRGADVSQLKENLTALGYTGFSADDRYTQATSRAVSRWQKDVGLPQTGRLGPEQVTVVRGPVRVASRSVEVGAPAASSMLTVTDVRRVVSFDLDPAKDVTPDVGAPATVELPGGTRAPGSISAVGPPVDEGGDGKSSGSDGQSGGGSDTTTVTVEVSLDDPALVEGLDASRVDIELVVEERPDVLSVPVTALVALAEGGHAVEVGADERRLVPVTVGMFASGRVEVSGELSEGDEVVVPS